MAPLRQKLSPLLTPLFRTYWRLSRPVTLGARVLALNGEGAVLLVRHSYSPGWHLPGGGVERLETAEAAARRELAEEGGVMAHGPLALFGFYANHANYKNDHVAVFLTRAVTPCPPENAGEIAERGFFAFDALPDGVTSGTHRRLEELFADAPRSADW